MPRLQRNATVAYVRNSPDGGTFYASQYPHTNHGRGGPYFHADNPDGNWLSHAIGAHWNSKSELVDALSRHGIHVVDQTT